MRMNCSINFSLCLRKLANHLGASILAVFCMLGMNPVALSAEVPGQATFDTAELAVDAFEQALAQNDTEALLGLFGKQFEHQLMADDAQNRDFAAQILKEKKILSDQGKDKKILYAGDKLWPFPVPIIKSANGWFFDTVAGIEEMVNRRIGRNELNAIEMCRFYSRAQIEYALLDRDGDQVLEYVQQIKSAANKKNGLFWVEPEGGELSPFGPLVAEAKGFWISNKLATLMRVTIIKF